MTAGSGVMHSEMGTDEFHKKGGPFEIIQVWMNLPKKLKMATPNYQGFQKNEIPVIEQDNGKVKIALVSGKIGNTTGPVNSITGVTSYTIYMEANSNATLETAPTKNIVLYLLSGNVTVNGRKIEQDRSAITFIDDATTINIEASSSAKFLFLQGEAIKEPVAQYGPFVMNTVDELHQAFEDYQSGKMGVLND